MNDDLRDQIADAKVRVAMSAIGNPDVYPQWDRLRAADAKAKAAHAELLAAKWAWEKLIEAAPPEWKKLAPRLP